MNTLATSFAGLGLSKAALSAVKKLGYTDPTPVQEQTIPLVLEGRDVVAAASTGTGKTAAFLLPTMSTLPRAQRGCGPKMLVVSPTRELASQIGDVCFKICRETGHFMTSVFGGTKYGPQIKSLRRGVDILIATPGRLNDLMERGVVDLSGIEVLVLDEADRMLDMGFLPDMKKIIAKTPAERQTLLFSATIDRKVMKNVGDMLRNPELVEIAHRGQTAATVEQYVMPITQGKKPELLRAVLEEKGSERIIVFARTKNRTEECMEQLRAAGFRAESIHSDKSQFQRKRALDNFTKGKTSILVATDVLARGIDVSGVDHVINFDLPDAPEDYVHRIGRTGRAGEAGYAISFVSRETRNSLRDIERLIGTNIPFMELEGYELDPAVLAGKPKGAKRSGGNGYQGNKRSGGYQGKRTGGYQGKRSGSNFGSSSSSSSERSGSYQGKRSGSGTGSTSERPGGYTKKAGAGTGSYRGSGKPSVQRNTSKPQAKRSGGYDYSRFAPKAEKAADRA